MYIDKQIEYITIDNVLWFRAKTVAKYSWLFRLLTKLLEFMFMRMIDKIRSFGTP
jgi:hypothetical protein